MLPEKKKRIEEIEALMATSDFWLDKQKAQGLIKELQDLKATIDGGSPYDAGDAVMTVFAGAGGDDAEDFAGMLVSMYQRYTSQKGFSTSLIHEHRNDHGGIRNMSFDIKGKNVFKTLKNESGVHRLVRISPFNAKSLRHTAFAMVEVIPKLEKDSTIDVADSDLKIEFAKAGGPGGQNVNKRETAVRVVHIPTKISVHVSGERSQVQNKEKAIELIKGKIYTQKEIERKAKEKGMQISSTVEAEWGSQIRSYVLHPYKLVKDHRTGLEDSDTEGVFEGGKLEKFIEAEKDL